ncbi:MAG: hypothetical protein JJE50_15510, partial [Actinomycetales bacterium]|nr:hypothetical protein [Actinomycetales bacterium]
MNRPHFRRHPRIAPDPARGKRPDRADGLPLRASGGVIAAGRTVIVGSGDPVYSLDGLPGRTRYAAQWPDVIAAETPAPLVDLPADQSGFTAL